MLKVFDALDKRKVLLKQEAMLRIALLEIGIDPSWLRIRVDHKNGHSYLDDIQLPVIFPKLFFDNCSRYAVVSKDLDFYFDGHPGVDKERERLLRPFMTDNSLVVFSNEGRLPDRKGAFNSSYFDSLARARYTLCPHQRDWPFKDSVIWTYRFIEGCMGFSIPVVFRETPLSDSFTKGIEFVYDDDFLPGRSVVSYDGEVAKRNYLVAMDRFTISESTRLALWVRVKKKRRLLSWGLRKVAERLF